MDCNLARLLWPFAGRQGELADDDAAALEQHLGQCSACASFVQAERRLDERLTRSMQDVPVPADLRERIDIRLAAHHGRLLRTKLLRYAVVAVGVILVGLLAGWWGTRRHTLDPVSLADAEDLRVRSIPAGTPEALEDYFQQKGHKIQLPTDLDYNLVSNIDIVNVEGESIAQLDLQRGEKRLRLQIFPTSRFRAAPKAPTNAAASTCVVELVESADGRFVYVLILYGDAARADFQAQPGTVG